MIYIDGSLSIARKWSRRGRRGVARGVGRAAEAFIHMADARNRSTSAGVIRRVARFPPHPIPMYWFSGYPNFGDALSPVVVEWVSNGIPTSVRSQYRGKLLAVGSILDSLAPGDWVWGSGAIQDAPIIPPSGVVFYAVRGPLTRGLVQADVPEVYGDPAMLLPLIYTPRAAKRFGLGVIPHVVDSDGVQVSDPGISKIDLQADWRSVIDRIVECETVITSSLHGLIVAEAYGVPAGWMTVSDKVVGEGFKFRDYYLSTGRDPPESLVWRGEPWRMTSQLSEPPHVDTAPLLRAWPAPLAFRGKE